MNEPQVHAGVEIELKLLLVDEDAWRSLVGALSAHGEPLQLRQRNLYLDTADDQLRRSGVMVRIRLQGARVVVTCKTRAVLQQGVMRAGEWEAVLGPEQASSWLDGTRSGCLLAELPIVHAVRQALSRQVDNPRLEVRATMDNHRQRWAIGAERLGWPVVLVGRDPVILEVDRATLPGGVERFELEIEHPQAGALAPRVQTWLSDLGLSARPAMESKYAQLLGLLDRAAISRRV